ncbi:MAG: DegT/DnrJ/EryC1/StrS family aminotransferase [Chloroflexota bacterium]
MSREIPLFKIHWDEADIVRVSGVIRSGMNWAGGSAVSEFESALARYVGTRYAVAFNSGTSALHATMLAYGFGAGDEVIVPSFTFIATANAPLFVGAKPVFADIEETTFGLDAEDVAKRITKKTKALMPIHYGGFPCRVSELKELAEENGLVLIEDAAEALGAKLEGRMVASFGVTSILSFCQNKVITTGEGGAVVTDSKDIYEKLGLIRSHGRAGRDMDYFTAGGADYIALGYNFRMSTITAALGLAQLEKIDKIIEMRRARAGYLTERLTGIKGLALPTLPPDSFSVYQMFPVRVSGGRAVRDRLKKYLAGRGITSRVYFEPVHRAPFYAHKSEFKGVSLPVTEKVSGEILCLPIYPALTKAEMDYIAQEIRQFFKVG